MSQLPDAPIHRRLGITITEAGPDRCVGTMPVEGNTQPFGLLHGGASCVLAESLASIAAVLWAGPGRIAVGVDLNATHHRGVRGGSVTGVATPLHRGRTTATYEVAITDEDGRRVCTARLTCHLRDAGPRAEPPGGSSAGTAIPAEPGAG
ncbi:PaaI family thioesterase [Actinopolymorpha singaporensis]